MPDHEPPDIHMLGTASIGMETKLTCPGKVSSADMPRHPVKGEPRAKNTYTVEHPHGLHNNYVVCRDRKSPSNKKEPKKSEWGMKEIGPITAFACTPANEKGPVKAAAVPVKGKK